MSAPYMPLFCGDYLGDTRHLTTEQHGAYLLLLMIMWRSDGFLPDDDRRLAQYAGLSPAKWKKHKDIILDFFEIENGRIFSRKILELLQKYDEKSQKNKKSGSKGGRAKSLKNNDIEQADAKQSLSEPKPELKPSISDKDKSLSSIHCETKKSDKKSDEFQEFYDLYPPRGEPPTRESLISAERSYKSARKKHSHEFLLGKLALCRERWSNPQYIPKLSNWLKDEKWNEINATSSNNYRPSRTRIPDCPEGISGEISGGRVGVETLAGRENATIDGEYRRIA